MPRDEAIRRAFGAALRILRTREGISQEKLATKARINRTYVGDVERGERNIAVVNIVKLCRALGVSLSEFFREVERHVG